MLSNYQIINNKNKKWRREIERECSAINGERRENVWLLSVLYNLNKGRVTIAPSFSQVMWLSLSHWIGKEMMCLTLHHLFYFCDLKV